MVALVVGASRPFLPYYPLDLFREAGLSGVFPVRAWLCGFFPTSTVAGSPALRRWGDDGGWWLGTTSGRWAVST